MSNLRVLGTLFKVVVQAVLFFGLETWAMNPHMGRALRGVSSQGGQANYREVCTAASGKKLGVPPISDINSGGGFEEVEAYVTRRQNTVAQYIVTRKILNLCK